MKPHLSIFAVPSEPPPLPGPSARQASPQRCWARPCSPFRPARGGAWARRPLRPRYSAPLPPTQRPGAPPPPPTHGFSRLRAPRLSPRPTPPYRSLDRARAAACPCPSHALSAPSSHPAALYRPGPSAPAHTARRPPGSRMTTPNRSPPSGPFYSSTRPGAPLTPPHPQTHTGSQIQRHFAAGTDQRALTRTRPHLPPHAALPTISASLRPHPGLWPLPVSSSSGSPPGPRAQFRALFGRGPPSAPGLATKSLRLRTPKL